VVLNIFRKDNYGTELKVLRHAGACGISKHCQATSIRNTVLDARVTSLTAPR
jgi:hypothetical protein